MAVVANCGLLQNDGSSFFLLNAGGILLLNDNTCGTEAGVSASVLAGTGTGVSSFVGFSPAADATAPLTQGAGWADLYQARLRQERWEVLRKRMDQLERKKRRYMADVADGVRYAREKLAAVEAELNAIYIEMLG